MAKEPLKADEALGQEEPPPASAKIETRAQEDLFSESIVPDLPPLELPPLDLPPIPELDLSALDKIVSQPPPPRRKVEYGSGNKDAGPVSFEQMLAHSLPPDLMQAKMVSLEKASSQPVELIDLGAPAVAQNKPSEPSLTALPGVQPVPHVEAEDIIGTQEPTPTRGKPERVQRPRQTPVTKRQAPPMPPERPRTTPLVFSRPPPVPLKERVIEFDEEEATPIRSADRIQVNLKQGYISAGGIEQPIDAALQISLLKLKEFFGQEFDLGRLQQLRQQVRGMAAAQKPSGELLKAVITPVLKLGARRYAVINELLQVKEQLPLLEQSVAAAFLEEVLSA